MRSLGERDKRQEEGEQSRLLKTRGRLLTIRELCEVDKRTV